jgi:hypothetical protein
MPELEPIDYDPFSAAAYRMRQSVQPTGGRQEGAFTSGVENFLPQAHEQMIETAMRAAWGDPGASTDIAMSMLMPGRPPGALGSGAARFTGAGEKFDIGQLAKDKQAPEKLYHVVSPQHEPGAPLRSLYSQYGDAAYDLFAEKWPEAGNLNQEHAHRVFFYDNLAEAQSHAKQFGGRIIGVDPSKVEGLHFDTLERPYGKSGYWTTTRDVPAGAQTEAGQFAKGGSKVGAAGATVR